MVLTSVAATVVAVALTIHPPALPVAPAPHNLHVAHTRMVIEGNVAVARIRLFRDDLEKALRQPVTDSAPSKAAVSAYVSRTFLLSADGAALTADVLESGADLDGDQPIRWLLVQWKAAKPIRSVAIRAHVLFETFKDQQNIVQVSHSPSDERRGLYFQAGDLKEQVLKF